MKSKRRLLILSLPRYGLANKLITWAKAWVWCNNNNVDLHTNGWVHFPIGSILRKENRLRWYQGFFKSDKRVHFRFWHKEQTIKSINDQPLSGIKRFGFKATPYISDLKELQTFQHQIKNAFYDMISQEQINKCNQQEVPIIGVHIRRGDFVKTGSSVHLDYYINTIEKIRKISKKELPVTVFSDGFECELLPVLSLPNTKLFKSVNDLVDLLVLSKSRILITSLSSSYSYWAAFFSDGIIIHHPKTWVKQCRPDSINNSVFEGLVNWDSELPELLKKNMADIQI